MSAEQTVFGFHATAAVPFGLIRRISKVRAALMFAALMPAGALAQTPADLARLSGTWTVPAAVSAPVQHRTVAVGGGSAADLARLAPAAASVGAAPSQAASGGAFAASDLARVNAAGVATWRVAPDLAVAMRP